MNSIPSEIVIAIISSSFSALVSGVAAYLVYQLQTRDKRREEDSRKREEEQEKLEAKRYSEYSALKEGVQSILRDRLIQTCQQCEERGWVSVPVLENIGMMYASYHALGGNGVVTELYLELKKLPHVKP